MCRLYTAYVQTPAVPYVACGIVWLAGLVSFGLANVCKKVTVDFCVGIEQFGKNAWNFQSKL